MEIALTSGLRQEVALVLVGRPAPEVREDPRALFQLGELQPQVVAEEMDRAQLPRNRQRQTLVLVMARKVISREIGSTSAAAVVVALVHNRTTPQALQLHPQEVEQEAVAVALSSKRKIHPSPIDTEPMARTQISQPR